MAGMNGTDLVIGVDVGAPGSPSFAILASQKGVKLDENVAAIDQSNKDQAAQQVIGGRYKWSASLDALYIPSNANYAILKAKFRNRELVSVRKELQGGDFEQGQALITSMSEDFPDQGSATVAMSLDGNGVWSAV